MNEPYRKFLLRKNLLQYGEKGVRTQYGFPDPVRQDEVYIERRFLSDDVPRDSARGWEMPWNLHVATSNCEVSGDIADWILKMCDGRILFTLEIMSPLHKAQNLKFEFFFKLSEEPLWLPGMKNTNFCIAKIPQSKSTDFVPPSYWDAVEVTGLPEYSLYSIAANGVPQQ